MSSMGTIINNTELDTRKLLREQILTVTTTCKNTGNNVSR